MTLNITFKKAISGLVVVKASSLWFRVPYLHWF